MEPQLVDFYNEMPSGINVIEKMNDELSELQKNYADLTRKYKELEQKNPQMPKIRVKSRDELRVYGRKVYYSVDTFTQIIRDFLNHEGWILEYDNPCKLKDIMGYAGCGDWDTWEKNDLKWGNTTAQKFYYGRQKHTEYNIYLKCKLLQELYSLFPEYKNREYNWFHRIIDDCFSNIRYTIHTILTQLNARSLFPKWQLHDIIFKTIMEQLFGWGREIEAMEACSTEGVFPINYDNSDYIQNIIYYQCEKCKKIFAGEDAMEQSENEDDYWYDESGNPCREPCKCN